jgi:hypothetical protein
MADPERMDDSAAASLLSRRSLIKQAATVRAVFAPTAGAAPAAEPAASHASAPHGLSAAELLVVRVVDAGTGELDFCQGHRHRRVRDLRRAAELLRKSDDLFSRERPTEPLSSAPL